MPNIHWHDSPSASFENQEIHALVISQLISDPQVPNGWRHLLWAPLSRSLDDTEAPISHATLDRVFRTLLGAACGDDLEVAKPSIMVLVGMSARGDFDNRLLVASGCSKKLISNYKATITPGSLEGQDVFEFNLGIRKPR